MEQLIKDLLESDFGVSLSEVSVYAATELDYHSRGDPIGFIACNKLISYLEDKGFDANFSGEENLDYDCSTLVFLNRIYTDKYSENFTKVNEIRERAAKDVASLTKIVKGDEQDVKEVTEMREFCVHFSRYSPHEERRREYYFAS